MRKRKRVVSCSATLMTYMYRNLTPQTTATHKITFGISFSLLQYWVE